MQTDLLANSLTELQYLIRKVSYQIANANTRYLPEMTADDYQQELYRSLVETYNKLEEEKKTVDSVRRIFIRMIQLEKSHFTSKHCYIARRSRDVVVSSIVDSYEDTSPTHHSSRSGSQLSALGDNFSLQNIEEEMDMQFYMELAVQILKANHEPKHPGVTRWWQEALNPSEEMIFKYRVYLCEKLVTRSTTPEALERILLRIERNLSKPAIPPTILLEFLGHSRGAMFRFKRVIAYVYADLGLSVDAIKDRWNGANYCFEHRQYGVT